MKKIITGVSMVVLVLSLHQQSDAQVCFNPAINFPAGINSGSLCFADFNGDSIQDLAIPNINGSDVTILIGDGTGSFAFDTTVSVGALPRSICSADFNHDGHADFATANSGPGNVSVCLGDGTGGFGAGPGFGTGVFGQSSICSADFNGDTIPDLVITSSFNYVLIALGTGNGGFNSPTQITADNSTRSVTSADFNHDGKADLAITTYNGSSHVSILLGNGTGGFGSATNFPVGASPVSIINSDFNRDGKIDLATVNMNNNVTGDLSVLLGNGTGGFAAATSFGVGVSTIPKSICSADFDGDSIPDLAISCIANNSTANVSILTGDGTGGFGLPVIFTVDSFPNSLVTADFNRDGKIDVALATCKSNIDSGNVNVLLNCRTTGIQQFNDNAETLTIYPNPSNGRINIKSLNNIDELKITNVPGQVIYKRKLNEKSASFLLDSPGIYFITITTDKKTRTEKLIVSH